MLFGRLRRHGLLAHARSLSGYGEPETSLTQPPQPVSWFLTGNTFQGTIRCVVSHNCRLERLDIGGRERAATSDERNAEGDQEPKSELHERERPSEHEFSIVTPRSLDKIRSRRPLPAGEKSRTRKMPAS
jgi:hypothetical protein